MKGQVLHTVWCSEFWWGYRGNLKLDTLWSERVEAFGAVRLKKCVRSSLKFLVQRWSSRWANAFVQVCSFEKGLEGKTTSPRNVVFPYGQSTSPSRLFIRLFVCNFCSKARARVLWTPWGARKCWSGSTKTKSKVQLHTYRVGNQSGFKADILGPMSNYQAPAWAQFNKTIFDLFIFVYFTTSISFPAH